MPRYFFNIYDHLDLQDTEGVELSDHKAALEEAVSLIGRLLYDNSKGVKVGEDCRLEVLDETGLCVFRLDFHVLGVQAAMGEEERIGGV